MAKPPRKLLPAYERAVRATAPPAQPMRRPAVPAPPVNQEAELLRFGKAALKNLPQSAVFVGVMGDMEKLDAGRIEFMLQLGYSLLVGKPIILTVPSGQQLPKKLAAIADKVVYYDPDNMESVQDGLVAALRDTAEDLR